MEVVQVYERRDMTRKEAIEVLTSKDVSIMLEALEMAIEALEQESVIDKIRIEIEKQIIPRSSYTDKQKKQVLAIIDKYRSELDCHECKTAHDCYKCEKYKENDGMTNKEKFQEVFGDEPQRQYATKSWWEQEYVPPITKKSKNCLILDDICVYPDKECWNCPLNYAVELAKNKLKQMKGETE